MILSRGWNAVFLSTLLAHVFAFYGAELKSFKPVEELRQLMPAYLYRTPLLEKRIGVSCKNKAIRAQPSFLPDQLWMSISNVSNSLIDLQRDVIQWEYSPSKQPPSLRITFASKMLCKNRCSIPSPTIVLQEPIPSITPAISKPPSSVFVSHSALRFNVWIYTKLNCTWPPLFMPEATMTLLSQDFHL